MKAGDRGSVTILVVVLLPLLLTFFVGVIQVGTVRVLAARVASAADLASLAAVADQDDDALAMRGELRLSPDAEAVARRYFGIALSEIAPHLGVTPDAAAAQADVAAFAVAPATDPLTGWRYDRPTVRIVANVPVRVPAFGALLLPPTTIVTVRAASAAR